MAVLRGGQRSGLECMSYTLISCEYNTKSMSLDRKRRSKALVDRCLGNHHCILFLAKHQINYVCLGDLSQCQLSTLKHGLLISVLLNCVIHEFNELSCSS